jgi:hypothetical protein
MNPLREKVQRLRERLEESTRDVLNPARGMWSPGDNGADYIVGSADDPKVKAGLEPLSWPEEDTP